MATKVTPIGKENEAEPLKADGIPKKRIKSSRTIQVIEKVQNPAINTDYTVSPEVENWIKMKLWQWDKDQNGQFTVAEVQTAMDELAEQKQALADMKWKFIAVFGLIFCFLVVATSTVLIALVVSKDIEVPASGELRAPSPDENRKGQTDMVATTRSRGSFTLLNMLNFDTTSDGWLIADEQLREIDTVSFSDSKQNFYHLTVAELLRVDTGTSGTNDKLEVTTASGTRLRVWESVGELEIMWPDSTMWEGADNSSGSDSGGRLLSDDEEFQEAPDVDYLLTIDDGATEGPPDRRLAKGGVRYIGGSSHYNSGGGGARTCNGRCYVSGNDCTKHCQIGACYYWGGYDYICNGSVFTFLSSRISQSLIQAVIVAAIFMRT